MLRKLKLAYKIFSYIVTHKIDIFTLITIFLYYIDDLSNDYAEEQLVNGMHTCRTKLPFIEPFRSKEENQKNLNSVTEAIRKHGLTWLEKTNEN